MANWSPHNDFEHLNQVLALTESALRKPGVDKPVKRALPSQWVKDALLLSGPSGFTCSAPLSRAPGSLNADKSAPGQKGGVALHSVAPPDLDAA